LFVVVVVASIYCYYWIFFWLTVIRLYIFCGDYRASSNWKVYSKVITYYDRVAVVRTAFFLEQYCILGGSILHFGWNNLTILHFGGILHFCSMSGAWLLSRCGPIRAAVVRTRMCSRVCRPVRAETCGPERAAECVDQNVQPWCEPECAAEGADQNAQSTTS
jgi:hypothetical protein